LASTVRLSDRWTRSNSRPNHFSAATYASAVRIASKTAAAGTCCAITRLPALGPSVFGASAPQRALFGGLDGSHGRIVSCRYNLPVQTARCGLPSAADAHFRCPLHFPNAMLLNR
jgi:hypothetical protein